MSSHAADQHGVSLKALCADLAGKRNVIVASNRGPVIFRTRDDGPLASLTGSGPASGALTPLQGILPLTWISASSGEADRLAAEASPGGCITDGLPPGWGARFISPSRRAYHRFYNIICNPLLWFLHHRSWGFTHTPNIDSEAHAAWERGMVEVSTEFAQAIAAQARSAGKPPVVMLRDYHMHLVAGMTRELVPDAVIHYLVDVPWPEPGDWMFVPRQWRDDIFRSLLRCDVLGLSSARDARSFLRCVSEFVPQAFVNGQAVEHKGHTLRVRAYTPGVQEEALSATARSARTEAAAKELAATPGVHTFATAERAELHKNIVRCIRAYGALLDRQPRLSSSTRYLLVLAPPPPHLSQYRRYVSEIEQAAQDVNRRHGRSGWRPVQLHIENNYPMALAAMRECDTLVAVPLAYALSTTALSTPLVNRRDCSLIISETSGVAEVFGEAAAQVSPSDTESIAAEMERAAQLSPAMRESCFGELEAAALAASQESALERQVADVLGVL